MRKTKKPKLVLGTQFLAEIYNSDEGILKKQKKQDIRLRVSRLIKLTGFHELDRFYFRFPSGGITALIALRESHIAFHTWPEFGYATLDVYTCNYRRNNAKKTERLFRNLIRLFLGPRGTVEIHRLLR